jgi:drug/metabolite transporter (DMT)-like permease
MFVPGLISAVFYRRRPTSLQIVLGITFTIVLSGLLGYIQDAGTSRVWENVALAIVLGVVLYFAILAYLLYVYFPKRERSSVLSQPPPLVPGP